MLSLNYQGWDRTLVKIEQKAGYEIRTYRLQAPTFSKQSVHVWMAYNERGERIGTPDFAKTLVDRGIQPEWVESYRDIEGGDKVCCVGFCEAESRWYGWGVGGLAGFAVGDVADVDHIATTSPFGPKYLAKFPEYDLRVPVGFRVRNLTDAKRMAIAYADAVSVERTAAGGLDNSIVL